MDFLFVSHGFIIEQQLRRTLQQKNKYRTCKFGLHPKQQIP
jgi:hypothetical protein